MRNKIIFLILGLAWSLSASAHDMAKMSKPVKTGNPTVDAYDPEDTLGPTLDDCKNMTGVQDNVEQPQLAVIYQTVGDRGSRLHHALWHAVRSDLPAQQQTQVLTAFGQTWGQEHNYCPAPGVDADDPKYNAVGEDFLFMHRLMVQDVRRHLMAKNLKCISGWGTVQDTQSWPKPDSDTSGAKSDETYQLLTEWDAKFHDDSWLSTHSLSQLGMALELSTHNNLHMRFATTNPPQGFAGAAKDGGAPVPYDGKFPPAWIYDKPGYNWLADPYGAALNGTFWKIHGYVDSLIDRWLQLHGKNKISAKCDEKTDPACYHWRGQWVGDMPAWVDQQANQGASRDATKAGAGGPSQTDIMNCERMRRQKIGVIGAVNPCLPPNKDGMKAPGAAPIPTDPFDYAVQSACSGN